MVSQELEQEEAEMDEYLQISEDLAGTPEERINRARMSAQEWNPEGAAECESNNFETNFYVREQYVLAHSNNVDIVFNNNFEGQSFLKGLNFYKVITKR